MARETGARGSGLIAATLPVALAVGVFGVVYGAAAGPVFGRPMTIISSVIIFSGAAQFMMVALVAAGATPLAVLGGVATLALRHFPLGAVLRPRVEAGRANRALVSWFLLDETTGLALTRNEPPERTLAVSGPIIYAAWVLGTVLGLLGADIAALEPLAAVLFPVLFIGLAALTSSGRSDSLRALLAGMVTLAVLILWPAGGALVAIGIAILVAMLVPDP